MANTPKPEKSRANKGTSFGLTNSYLLFYNAASSVGWAYVLLLTVAELANTNGDFAQVYSFVGEILKWVQTAAILEVFHVLIGFVKSPVTTTVIQVASRLFLVWGVLESFPEIRTHWAFVTMTIAWCVTEIVRYTYYGFNLVGFQPGILLWARYTFFFVLYPVGAGSEFILAYQSLPYSEEKSKVYWLVQILILLAYIPGFYTMYTHMIRQRQKYLAASGKEKKRK